MDKLDGIFEEEHEDRLKNPYAKSSRLYLQQMEDLEKSMPTEEYTSEQHKDLRQLSNQETARIDLCDLCL